jgi:DNA replication and repair protein RecF
VLLLDEIAAHLDPLRRAALFDRLAQTGSQVWMTGTDAALFDAVGAAATRLHVENGVVTA